MTLSWIRLTLPLSVALLPACTPPPTELTSTSDGASSSSSEGPGPSTTPGTTLPGEDTMGTQGATGTDTTMGAADTTADASVGTDDTTMGVEPTAGSDSTTGEPPRECAVPDDCDNNETCDGGTCVSACNPWGPNDYSYCVTPLGTFDSATICGEPLSCIITSVTGAIQTAVCGRSCGSACDCPAPPATGNATVTCGDVIQGGSNECYLSCANGETCPDGMSCLQDDMGNPVYCSHPVQPSQAYGNCDNIAAGCAAGYTCATSGSHSVCTELCPGGDGDCDPALPGAASAVACEALIAPPDGDDCHMPCGSSNDCPDGMDCINVFGQLCMWP